MKSVVTNVFIFAAGAAVGSVVTWKLVKTKYEQIANEEIESVKKTFSRGKRVENNPIDDSSDLDIEDMEKILAKNGYDANVEVKEKKEEPNVEKPYVISPEEFGECDYATITLNYYADGVVTNVRDKIVNNVDELVGVESLNHFGEFEDDPDTVYVRNDKQKIDYEILRDYRNFSEVD